MIDLEAICEALPRLGGDAVRLAVYLARRPTRRADAAWARVAATEIGTTPKILSRALKELADEGLIDFMGRVDIVSTSHGCRSLARAAEMQLDLPGALDDSSGGVGISDLPTSTESTWGRSGPPDRHGEPRDLYGGHDARAGVQAGAQAGARDPTDAGTSTEPATPSLKASAAAAKVEQRVGDHRRVVAEITAMYAEVYEGAKCTWGPREGRIVKMLLAKHSVDEIIRRARVMFFEPRKWPEPPYDVGTLSSLFDKFVGKGDVRGGVSGLRATRDGEGYYGEVTR